jgi:protein TonB
MSTFDVTEYRITGDAVTRRRWGKSFAIIAGLHVGVATALVIGWKGHPLVLEAPPPAILIDLQPSPPAPPRPKVVEEQVKPKEPPVIEKAEVTLNKPKPIKRPAKPKPEKPKPDVAPQVESTPAAPKLAQAPVKAKPSVTPDYLSALFAHLERYTRYPRMAGWRKPEGVVMMRVSFDRTGHVLSAAVSRSSGYAVLDEAALDAVERADPLPAFPDTMPQSKMTLNIPVRFNIKN